MKQNRNYFKSVSLLIVAMAILTLVSQVQAINVNKIIKKVQNTYEDMDNLSASFVQIETFKLTGSQTEVVGKLYVKNGKSYRFETEDQVFVTDGKTVWTYNLLSKQLIIDNVRENSGALIPRDMLFKYPKTHFATLISEEEVDGKAIYQVRLDPKEESSSFLSAIKIWVEEDTWTIRKMETIDLNGNSRVFEIRDMDSKTKLDDSLFIYTAPEGSDVMDMRK